MAPSPEQNKEVDPSSSDKTVDAQKSTTLSDKDPNIGATDQKLLDQIEILAKDSLEDGANCFSKMWLSYLDPLLRQGAIKPLTPLDLGGPAKEDKAEFCHDQVMKAYNDQPKDKKSISRALVSSFGFSKFLFALFLYIISAALQFLPVLILNDLIKYFQAYPTVAAVVNPWIEVALLFVIPTLVTLLQARHNVTMAHMSVFVRTAVSITIYEKIMKISSSGRAKTSTGAIVNMMSNDTTQVQRFIQFLGFVTTAPFQVAFSLYLIYQQVGVATFAGVGFLIGLIPINICVFYFVSKNRRATLKESDSRVKLVSEVLSGIRIIKFYAWESPFRKAIEDIRESELVFLTKLAYISAIGFSMIMLSAPIILPIVVFAVYIATSNEPLDAATAFTTVALFNIMRFPFAFMPMGFLQYIQAKIAMGRIDFLLTLPELEEYVVVGEEGEEPDTENEIIIENSPSFSWGVHEKKEEEEEEEGGGGRRGRRGRKNKKKAKSNEPSAVVEPTANTDGSSVSNGDIELEPILTSKSAILSDINLKVKRGELYGVVGSVGSGKSSLLSCILGDMEPLDPNTKVSLPFKDASNKLNYTSYCAQTPWVVNDTLRGNILFGRAYDEARYSEVVQACALIDDLAVLPAGDLTEIGEKGINLSGGQKARVSLARAMYNVKTRLMLLDDPLSAVDSHVGEHLFEKAINGKIAAGTTRLLVTHHVHFLPRCYKVIVMKDGKIEHCDKYNNLVKQGVDFAGATKFKNEDEPKGNRERAKSRSSSIGSEGDAQEREPAEGEGKKQFTKDEEEKGRALTKDEDREEGSVSLQAYYHYCKAGGWLGVFGIIFVQSLGKASEIGAGFWLAIWADESLTAQFAGTPLSDDKIQWYLNIYAMLAMGGVAALTARSLIMAQHRLSASRQLHNELTTSIIRAPVSYFDVTPTGRILNRFAADMDKIDLELSQSLAQGTGTMFNVAQAYVTIAVATKGLFLIPLIPIGFMYYYIQKWFRKSSTEIQRVENITRSPIFSDFSQTLSGTSTIRAYGEEDRFTYACKLGYDVNNASYQLVQQTGNWLGIRLDIIGGFISAFVAGLALATVKDSFIPAGWVGLALLESQQATNFLKHGVRMVAQVEANMSSVERVLHMSQTIEPEADETTDNDPKQEWPKEGKITVDGATMRYRDGPIVLKKLSFQVEGGQKIGVVGRTGSGKSSLMTSLFRIVELSEGGITIDGIDISQIGTFPLRSKLSIIPQDPTLFSNTVKYNLDPFGESSDEELWDILEKCQLGDVVRNLTNGLDEAVTEGGSNFSQGQRQLLCIARSVLRKPKILVCDEATASIDNETDRLIQLMIRDCFKDATVLTIAHRLGTVMDSDKVLVLDDGKLAEFDRPEKLMKIKGGIFRGMVEANENSEKKK